ncbi:MAG: hypothetical protein SFW08_01930 [Gemmatimonadaceae bacterium]|nr:hypothetical protein [Gemmatimonadaceae bacterium]
MSRRRVRATHWMHALAAVAVVGAATPAAAQNCTVNGAAGNCTVTRNISMPVQRTIRMTLSSTATALTPPLAAAYDAGFQDTNGPTITVQANSAWRVQISAAAANFTGTGALARANKPRADLRWGIAPAVPTTPLSATATTIGTGVATNGTVLNVVYRTIWSWALDTPGTYTLAITYTLITP